MTQEQRESLLQLIDYLATMFSESYRAVSAKGGSPDTALHFATTMATTTLSAMYAQSQPKTDDKAIAEFMAMVSHGSKGH
jgi:hypothetical protein